MVDVNPGERLIRRLKLEEARDGLPSSKGAPTLSKARRLQKGLFYSTIPERIRSGRDDPFPSM